MLEIDKKRIKKNLEKAKTYEEEEKELSTIAELKKEDKKFYSALHKLRGFFRKKRKKRKK